MTTQDGAIKFIGAVLDEFLMYSDEAADYTRLSSIGFGASSVVYEAVYHHQTNDGRVKDLPCALKVLNLDKLQPSALRLLTRETQLMSLSKHPNVLRVRGSWMMGPQLYIAMRLMKKGSVADIMKYAFIDGLEEDVIKCVLHQALQGLNYLHVNGFIHRDVKAANLLVDDDGTVLLGDLGVAVSLADEDDAGQNSMMSAVRRSISNVAGGASAPQLFGTSTAKLKPRTVGKRKSFVGTPSWMAPEVISGQHYDSSADIWSLGITILEMCNGRAPSSRERDVKRVLLGTLRNAPPTLDRDGGKFKYSKSLKDLVESCLVKEPSQRPTAERLLRHDFFRGTKKKEYLLKTLLDDVPPLSERQERLLLSTQDGRAHHLALGSPSITSVHNRPSWDWTFPNPVSPRSTAFSRKEVTTPAGSMRGHSREHTHAEGVTPAENSIPQQTRSRHRISQSLDINRSISISPTRTRNHSRVPSYVPKEVENSLPEVEGEDDMRAINAELEKLAAQCESPLDENPPDRVPDTPHVHAEDEKDYPPNEIDPILLAPPELSSSASSARESSLGNRTPASSLPTNLAVANGQFPKPPIKQLLRTNTALQSPVIVAGDDVGSDTHSGAISVDEPARRRLWDRVKSAASRGRDISGAVLDSKR